MFSVCVLTLLLPCVAAEEGGASGVFYAAPAALVWPPDSADSGEEDGEEDQEEDEEDAQTVILKSSPFSSPGTIDQITTKTPKHK